MSPIPIISVQPLRGLAGPGVQHSLFLKHLDRRKFEVHAIIPENHGMEAAYQSAADSVSVLPDMPTVPRTVSPIHLWRYYKYARVAASRIADIARTKQARLIHCFVESYPPSAMAAPQLDVPSVIQVVGMTIFRPWYVAWGYCRILNHLADRLIGCQEVTTRKLAHFGVPARKLRVVYNGIDVEEIRREAADNPRPDLPTGALKVGMVAGMDPRKGHILLIKAAGHVCRRMPQAHFYLIGSVEPEKVYYRIIREAIDATGFADRIHLIGRVPHIAPWIAAMDVYCNSSLTEALSVASIEAMALGRPVVATNVDGNPVAVVDGETGLLCRPEDPLDLADKLVAVLQDPDRLASFGNAGRRRAETLFTIEHNAAALGDVFAELLHL